VGVTNGVYVSRRVRRVLWSLPHRGELCPPVRQHGRTRRPVRLSRILRKPPYVYALPLSAHPYAQFRPTNRPLSTCVDIERLYGERKLLAERKPLPRSAAAMPAAHRRHPTQPLVLRHVRLQRRRLRGNGDRASRDPSLIACPSRLIWPFRASTGGNGQRAAWASASMAWTPPRGRPRVTKHDLLNQYFRKDVVVWSNLDWLRCVRSLLRSPVLRQLDLDFRICGLRGTGRLTSNSPC
jgi:hypothetical protein